MTATEHQVKAAWQTKQPVVCGACKVVVPRHGEYWHGGGAPVCSVCHGRLCGCRPGVDPDTPASDLLAEGECSPQCLLAGDGESCSCRCSGWYHGALRDAVIVEWW